MPRFFYSTPLRIIILVLLGIVVYSNTFNAPFHFDDVYNIAENPFIKDLSGVPSLFAGGKGPFSSRPLMHALNALNYHFGGLDTTGYHIVNLALHLLNGVLLYFLIVLTGRHLGHGEKDTGLVAALSALLFVVHPVQTEGVTYIVSRSMLLASTFYLSGLILFLKAVTSERRRGFYIAGLFFTTLMGTASRENFATFPVMLVLYDLFFISRFSLREGLRHYKAYLPVAIAFCYFVYLALNNTYDRDMKDVIGIPPYEYLFTQFNVHWTYLRLLFLPVSQNLDYDYPTAATLFEFPTMLSFLGYIGLWITALALVRKRPVVSFGVLWFLVALVPISFAVAVMGLRLGDVIFEHRLYLPGAGIIVAFSTSAVAMMGRISGERARKAAVLCMALLLIVFSASAYKRNAVWQSDLSLWGDVVRKSPGNARAHNNLGYAYYLRDRIYRAIEYYGAALRIEPDNPEAHYNIGLAYEKKGLTGLAEEHYLSALRTDHGLMDTHTNLGGIYMEKGLHSKALEHYKLVVRMVPGSAVANINLGNAYASIGRYQEAIRHFRKAIELNPYSATTYNNLANAYYMNGQVEEAEKSFKRALQMQRMNR